ncbi:MAG TPA: hypothetical protein VFF06_07780 [Polyangia bacterium]|nr:hypothetical protein [Polyangia bacterium]
MGRGMVERAQETRRAAAAVERPDARALFELRDPRIVAEVLAHARELAPRVSLIQGGAAMSGRIVAGPANDGLRFELDGVAEPAAHRAMAARFELHGVIFLLRAQALLSKRAGWHLRGPLRLYTLDRRGSSRQALPPGLATVRWSAPGGHGGLAQAPVRDLVADGVCVIAERGAALPDGRFPAMLELEGRPILCLAERRNQRVDQDGVHYGVRLHTEAGREAMIGSYLRHRFPQLLHRGEIDRARLADLMERSGYSALRAGARPTENWFAAPGFQPVSRDVAYRAADGAVLGHMSATRVYTRTWLGHQFATLRGHAETDACRRAIYLNIASYPTLVDGEDAMLLGYFDRSKRWHKMFFFDFADWVNAPELVTIIGLDRFERAAGAPAPIAAPPAFGFEVGEPDPREVIEAAALIRAQLPPLVAEALDIDPEHLASGALHPAWRATPYFRARRPLVLRSGGRLVAVALCELGSREMCLFNLFNIAQLFFAPGEHAPPLAAQLHLLSRVRALYAERGEHNPMIVAPPGTFDATREPGTVLAETMGMIAWSGRALRQYETFIKYHFGRHMEVAR